MIQEGSDFGFVGEAYEAPMLLQDAQRCINWYCEVSENKTNGSKMPIALLGCPGLESIAAATTAAEVRGMWTLPGNTSALIVVGNIVYLISVAIPATSVTPPTFNLSQVGTLLTYTGPVSIRDNGVVFGGKGGFAVIVDGTYGYYYLISGVPNVVTFTGATSSGTSTITVSTIPNGLVVTPSATVTDTAGDIPANTTFTGVNFNSLTLSISKNATGSHGSDTITITIPVFGQITDTAFLPASMVAFIEGWLIFSEPNTRTFFTNATTPYTLLFAGSFYALKDSSTDNLVTLYENNRELWLIGERTSEVWYDAGNPNFAFSRIPAIGPQIGCGATHSITRLGPDLIWLGRNEQGQNFVVKQSNYQWERVSTHAIDKAISSYPVVDDAIGFSYEEEGHWFYVLTFPTADVTWVYDGKTAMWHQRAAFDVNSGQYHRMRANAYCNLADLRLVGDYQNGKIYQMSRQFYSDDGLPLRCQRRAPHAWSKQNRKRLFHSWLQVEFTPGVGNNITSNTNSGGYSVNTVDNGGTAYLTRGAQLSGVADGKTGSLSMWIRIDGGAGTFRYIFNIQDSGGGFQGLNCGIDFIDNIVISTRNSAGAQILALNTAGAYTPGLTWYNVLASWNQATGVTNLYINNVSDNDAPVVINDTIDYTKNNASIFANTVGSLLFNGAISELWFNPSFIDFSNSANRAKFINGNGFPVNLGSTGQIPTGTTPLVYLKNPAATFGTNLGTGGNFTTTGTLTSASTSPSTPSGATNYTAGSILKPCSDGMITIRTRIGPMSIGFLSVKRAKSPIERYGGDWGHPETVSMN